MARVYCCQHDIQWEDPPATCARVRELLAAAAPQRGSLVLLPEMFATGFTMNAALAAHALNIEVFLAELAAAHGIFIQAGLAAPAADGSAKALNVSLTLNPAGECVARYAKLQPFTPSGEAQCYAAGNGLAAFTWEGFAVAPFICYDLRFPELFRAATLRGATLFTVIANWPAEREAHWLTLLAARAIENQAYIAAVNRVGEDPKTTYSGRSVIFDPRGRLLADGPNAETVISAEIDPAALAIGRTKFPALADIRIEYKNALLGASGSLHGVPHD